MSKYTEHLRITAKALIKIADEQDAKEQPQPAPVSTLVELCEALLRDQWFTGGYCVTSEKIRQALTAEKRRQELVEFFIDAVRSYKWGLSPQIVAALENLDSFDKGAENG